MSSKDFPKFAIKPARGAVDIEDIRKLFMDYASWLNVDLNFQNFSNELDTLPGLYVPPQGELLLARNSDNVAIGCVGLRPLHSQAVCEMKRLYITPSARKHGLGRRLIDEIVQIAVKSGYKEMRLDTLCHMRSAINLYERCDFRIIEAYYANPLDDVVYLAKDLC